MVLKKKSIADGIKLILLIIIVLGVINFLLTAFYNKKATDKNYKIILLDKSLNNLYLIVDDAESAEEVTDALINKINLRLNLSESYFKIIKDGGKFEGVTGKVKITPAGEPLAQALSELQNKQKKISKNLKRNIGKNTFLSDKNVILNISDINYIIRKTEGLKKKLQKEADLYKFKKNFADVFTLILIGLAAVFTFFYLKNKLSRDIDYINRKLSNISGKEDVSPDFKEDLSREFNKTDSEIDSVKKQIKEVAGFVNNLLSDNYDVDFSSSGERDLIQKSLLNLRDKLKENIEINERRLEEEKKRQWFSEGQAKFNDILRETTSGIKKLAETSLINMVKFLNAAQGGFFIVNDSENEPYLELISAFAYDRIKMLTKRVEFGDGLVGMCAVEKNTILISEVPEDYMQIESGLGEAAPKNILIIPLKTEDNILGVIEIASFYEFKKDEVEFTESIAGDIATTLETTKISDKTNELLRETRKKSEELALRDSEMSEKISELRDAQKETKRSVSEMNALVSVIDKVLFKLELTTAGKINSANTLFLNKLGYNPSELRNKHFVEFIKSKDKKTVEDIYNSVSKYNFTEKEIIFISKENTEIKTTSFFSAVKNEKGEIIRILMLADNVSYREELQKKNDLLREELISKAGIISEKEKELSSLFSKIKNAENYSDTDIEKLKQRENKILESNETPADKKYALWLKDIKNKKK